MNVRTLTWAALGAWLAAVFLLAGAFVRPVGEPPIPILIGVLLPIAAFLAAYYGSAAFRRFVLSADPRFGAAVQAWRAGGLVFLALYTYGLLPAVFAFPAALGDIAIGVTAPWIVLRLMREPAFAASRAFVTWNLLGILDLVVAVGMGGGASYFGSAVPTTPMTLLPMVLIPAFLVPLFVMLHLTALFQAARAARPAAAGGSVVPAPAAPA